MGIIFEWDEIIKRGKKHFRSAGQIVTKLTIVRDGICIISTWLPVVAFRPSIFQGSNLLSNGM